LRLVPELGPGFASVIDGLEILRPAMCSALALCLLELEIEGVRYLPGHLRLEGKQILSTPVEAFRPEMRTRLCIEELRGHAHLAFGTAHAAFQDITHAQLSPELLHVHCLAAVGLHGVARDHESALETRQVCGQIFG